ncbi:MULTISPECIES: DUF6234 family protein [unclassified Streptomyces]|uniref:DUF6234 family protein n=1 Tax=unclassified Streptomyces TaxID=2593676 RepID=UPI00343501AD
MTNAVSRPTRPRPWSRPTSRGADLAFAIPVLLLGTGWLVLDCIYGAGLEVWAAQSDQRRIDAADLAHLGRLHVFLIAVLVMALLAGISRAWWTVTTQLLLALLAGGLLMSVPHPGATGHAGPTPPGHVRQDAPRGEGPV